MLGRLVVIAMVGACGRTNFDALSTDGAALDPSLALHFTFDQAVLADSSAGHHDATCANCPLAIGGQVGPGAAAFSPTSCMMIADDISLRPPVFTAALWANPVTATNGVLFARSFNGVTSAANTFGMWWDTGAGMIVFEVGAVSVMTSVSVDWHHVAAVVDPPTYSLYIDGAFAASGATGAAPYASDLIRIGCDLDVNVELEHFTGTIDDVRLYNRALSTAEIAALGAI